MILALSYLDTLIDWWMPDDTPPVVANNITWLAELFPNDLSLLASLVLPLHGHALKFALAVIFAVATATCWLAIRRWAPPRLVLWRFVAALIAWPILSFGFSMLLVEIWGLIYRSTHGG